MSLQEAAGVTAEGGVSSAESTADDLTSSTESEEDEETDEDMESCDDEAVAHAEHLHAVERAVSFATKLARRVVKAWLWHDKSMMEAAVVQMPQVMVTRQVAFAYGLMHVLRVRKETLWNVLGEAYRSRVATLYSAWLKKLRKVQDEGLDGTVTKAKSLLGAYAKLPSLFLKRCRDLEAWLMENSLWDATFISARRVATVLVAHDVSDWKLLHTVTDKKLVKWFRDDQCLALLRPLVDKLKVTNELEYREMRAKRRRMAVAGQNKVIPGSVVLGQATDDHLLTLQTCLKEAADDLGVSDLFEVTPRDALRRFQDLKQRGKQVDELLLCRAQQCAMSTRSGSMGSVNSALKCWIMFAKQVLDYPDGQELPPKQESDVAQYAAIFRNSGIAANYLGTLKWYCLMQSLDASWATPRLKMQVKG